MMLALGMFVFMRQTLPFQTMQRDATYLWAANKRVGKRDAFQFTGIGDDSVTLQGRSIRDRRRPVSFRIATDGRGRACVAATGWSGNDIRDVCHQKRNRIRH